MTKYIKKIIVTREFYVYGECAGRPDYIGSTTRTPISEAVEKTLEAWREMTEAEATLAFGPGCGARGKERKRSSWDRTETDDL